MHGCCKEIDGAVGITLRLLFDYYRKKPQKLCPARLPRFFFKMTEICEISTKHLRRRAFQLDGLITPTTISYPTELNGAVSKCKSQENSHRQMLEKVVKIQLISDFRDFFIGLIFRNAILRQPHFNIYWLNFCFLGLSGRCTLFEGELHYERRDDFYSARGKSSLSMRP